MGYSYRSASMGSRLAARRAGMQIAATAKPKLMWALTTLDIVVENTDRHQKH